MQAQEQIQNVDINRPEANFTFEINDVQPLLDSRKSRGSEFFFCRSIRFYVIAQNVYFEGGEYFGVYLSVHNPSDTYYYSMATSYEFRLVNWNGKEDKIEKFNFNFGDGRSSNHGNTKFLPISMLTSPSGGWVKNDKLQLKVNLKCGNLFRNRS